jgi:glutaredoxin
MTPVLLEVLTSPGCTHCRAFFDFWSGEESNWPNVTLDEYSSTTHEGQALVSKYQIFTTPGVIVNGKLFSEGGVRTKQFLEKLKSLSGSG